MERKKSAPRVIGSSGKRTDDCLVVWLPRASCRDRPPPVMPRTHTARKTVAIIRHTAGRGVIWSRLRVRGDGRGGMMKLFCTPRVTNTKKKKKKI